MRNWRNSMPAATSASERRARWQQYALWLAVGLSGWLCLALTGAEPGKLLDREGLHNAGEILSGFAHPDLSAEFLSRVWTLSVESLLIGLLGSTLATFIMARFEHALGISC